VVNRLGPPDGGPGLGELVWPVYANDAPNVQVPEPTTAGVLIAVLVALSQVSRQMAPRTPKPRAR